MNATNRARKKAKTTSGQSSSNKPQAVVRAPQQRNRDNKGKLAGLMDLPMDLLFEVLSYLDPPELLRMARLSKQFRGLLMSKSSLSLWIRVIEASPGLPACPPGLNEPQWVSLAFDNVCSFCPAIVRTVLWELRARVCTKCIKQRVRRESIYWPITNKIKDVPLSARIYTLVPGKLLDKGPVNNAYFLTREVDEVEAGYLVAAQNPDTLDKFVEQRKDLVAAVNSYAQCAKDWATSQAEDRQRGSDAIRKERKEQIVAKLEELGWGPELKAMRYPRLFDDNELVKKTQKLTPRIWANIKGQLISFMERARERRIREERKELIEERKADAVILLRAHRLLKLPQTEPWPNAVEFCELSPIKDMINSPDDVSVTEDSFYQAFARQLPDMWNSWRASVDEQIVEHVLLSESHRPSFANDFLYNPDGEDPDSPFHFTRDDCINVDYWGVAPPKDKDKLLSVIKLARTVFVCQECQQDVAPVIMRPEDESNANIEPLLYPRVLEHACLQRGIRDLDDWDDLRLGPVGKVAVECLKRISRNFEPLRVNYYMSRSAISIISAAGQDPETTTAEEMDNLGLYFVCVACAVNGIPSGAKQCRLFAYCWRDAIVHQVTCHQGGDLPSWMRMSLKEVLNHMASPYPTYRLEDPDFPEAIKRSSERNNDTKSSIWQCAYCVDTPRENDPVTVGEIAAHLALEHDRNPPRIDMDYYRIFDTPPPFAGNPELLMLPQDLIDHVTVIRLPITLEPTLDGKSSTE